ncbi:peroxidase TAP [Exidia glandulosa HHB12029]|uniref:Peroxidase TAP n=1 Tax=Exidia glandulosa HHB12029 TaxID=1314781 RepID=A0A165GZG2_EXIGL|nr:peroxidase TAP [Exidia glandulosa HHB12029]
MRFAVFLALGAGCAAAVPAHDVLSQTSLLKGKRKMNLLQEVPGLVPLPSAAKVAGLDTNNIQGDILVGMKKKQERFIFWTINDPARFKSTLRAFIVPQITSVQQLLSTTTQPLVALNVAFSQTGLQALNITDNLSDAAFSRGQFADANALGDPDPTKNGTAWVDAFRGTNIHGVFLLASDNATLLDAQEVVVNSSMGSAISVVYTLQGSIRPGPQAGHEAFGYLDGVSQPHVDGFGTAFPGQQTIDPGVILVGEQGDSLSAKRPAWTTDGSFLAFRQLKQLVPEWNKFIASSAPGVPGLTHAQSVALHGARLVGRWKSGAPVDLSPLVDNATLGADPTLNNNFDYTHQGFDLSSDQSHCPFASHVRKTRPRADLDAAPNSIIRAGIPYGPEVTDDELTSATSTLDRGLAFVSYQSQIAKGFRFIQASWANNEKFSFGKNDTTPGFDAVIGANRGGQRFMSGYDINDASKDLSLLTDFVVSKGGEYFFSPSISALRDFITAP